MAVVNFDTDSSNINVYLPTDPRVQVLTELGFVNAPGVEKLAADNAGGTFFKTISYENIADIDADVIVGFTDGSGDPSGIPAVGGLDAVKRGSTAFLSDTRVIGGLSNVNVLSTPWVPRPDHTDVERSRKARLRLEKMQCRSRSLCSPAWPNFRSP